MELTLPQKEESDDCAASPLHSISGHCSNPPLSAPSTSLPNVISLCIAISAGLVGLVVLEKASSIAASHRCLRSSPLLQSRESTIAAEAGGGRGGEGEFCLGSSSCCGVDCRDCGPLWVCLIRNASSRRAAISIGTTLSLMPFHDMGKGKRSQLPFRDMGKRDGKKRA